MEEGRAASRTPECAASMQRKPGDLEMQEEGRQAIVWASVLVAGGGWEGILINTRCSALMLRSVQGYF